MLYAFDPFYYVAKNISSFTLIGSRVNINTISIKLINSIKFLFNFLIAILKANSLLTHIRVLFVGLTFDFVAYLMRHHTVLNTLLWYDHNKQQTYSFYLTNAPLVIRLLQSFKESSKVNVNHLHLISLHISKLHLFISSSLFSSFTNSLFQLFSALVFFLFNTC